MQIDWDDLPEQIQQFKPQILATATASVEIELKAAAKLPLWQSKLGGLPYLPLTESYPFDKQGKPLHLLAQINFAEMPAVENYPSQGLLQFFIGGDDLYGADFDHGQKQDGFRVKFYEQVIEDPEQLYQDFSKCLDQVDEDYYSPISESTQCAMSFAAKTQYISSNVFDFGQKVLSMPDVWDYEEILKDQHPELDFYEDWLEPYLDEFSGMGHRLGGYPHFTQADPREHCDEIKDYVLLLQIDSDSAKGYEIMWGDLGVGNFFIHPDDLKKRDFSKVLYNWDCG
ncbi:uncharacterized protein YwqG [Acinetobacter calcoaceticus]|uniref:Uncharacterized protein YwqG n=1 Tax=Acinetobacter calcoaceticus TaxID=471 RepID=A0A4R1Y0Z3_ACICA|nr:uncharacterized protein YwqG [Acinetobacter calcoaceticus]